jgi:hypothetical protein
MVTIRDGTIGGAPRSADRSWLLSRVGVASDPCRLGF